MNAEASSGSLDVIQLEIGKVYQLGRKALAVEKRGDELVLVLLAEAPEETESPDTCSVD